MCLLGVCCAWVVSLYVRGSTCMYVLALSVLAVPRSSQASTYAHTLVFLYTPPSPPPHPTHRDILPTHDLAAVLKRAILAREVGLVQWLVDHAPSCVLTKAAVQPGQRAAWLRTGVRGGRGSGGHIDTHTHSHGPTHPHIHIHIHTHTHIHTHIHIRIHTLTHSDWARSTFKEQYMSSNK